VTHAERNIDATMHRMVVEANRLPQPPNVPKLSGGDGEAGDVGCSAMLGGMPNSANSTIEKERRNESERWTDAHDGQGRHSASHGDHSRATLEFAK
jgi:hypothetical protein